MVTPTPITVICLDGATGEVLWRSTLKSAVSANADTTAGDEIATLGAGAPWVEIDSAQAVVRVTLDPAPSKWGAVGAIRWHGVDLAPGARVSVYKNLARGGWSTTRAKLKRDGTPASSPGVKPWHPAKGATFALRGITQGASPGKARAIVRDRKRAVCSWLVGSPATVPPSFNPETWERITVRPHGGDPRFVRASTGAPVTIAPGAVVVFDDSGCWVTPGGLA